jgi:hypothetical protein
MPYTYFQIYVNQSGLDFALIIMNSCIPLNIDSPYLRRKTETVYLFKQSYNGGICLTDNGIPQQHNSKYSFEKKDVHKGKIR